MAAAVEQDAHLAIFITHHDDGLAPDFLELEIAGVGNLPDVTDVDPSAMEDVVEFVGQDIRIGIQAGMETVAFDQGAIINFSRVIMAGPSSGTGFSLSLFVQRLRFRSLADLSD